MLELNNFYSY